MIKGSCDLVTEEFRVGEYKRIVGLFLGIYRSVQKIIFNRQQRNEQDNFWMGGEIFWVDGAELGLMRVDDGECTIRYDNSSYESTIKIKEFMNCILYHVFII